MQIFIKETNNQNKWFLIELQGKLEQLNPNISFKNEPLGILTKKASGKDDYQFIMGNTQLEGKEQPLKKPLLVIKKIKSDDNSNNVNIIDQMDIDKVDTKEQVNTEYIIEGVCTSKISFTTRPTIIIPQSSVQYGSPQHKSPKSSPSSSPSSSPISKPIFNSSSPQQPQSK
ncbi:hypothetical protein DLAC_01041 [Tieghemostelium lacteum]|uniref:Uncharacterized protein n=1 Tax=Tieghemostelium lacteum TaxID=361077 RepID=A0A152A7W5_TIELA|nr:hypothetical protein DLAC_01041 [Tieghemostelium lacteum]|eukprot:KYR02221.1 hypothetical protein DLAC_01041 [Tieghemostelium lacteum]